MMKPVATSAGESAEMIKQKAKQLGFDLCAITHAGKSTRRDYFLNWIESNQHGEMGYLAKRSEERLDTRVFFPPAKSVICVAMNYFVAGRDGPETGDAQVARYALGIDYHEHIKTRLHHLADFIRTNWPGAETKVAVDTAPVMERELAVRAGIGWQGKNTCVINPQIGSWLFLGELFTSLELPIDQPATDHCGTCVRCIEACPTGAITGAYTLDASKCISYLTIENRGEVAGELKPHMEDWIFGCDTCQDVCPFNGRAPSAIDEMLQPRFPRTLDAQTVANWSLDEYHSATRHSAMRRVKLPMFQRNARIVLENKK